jgi:hypothetical protein
MRYAEHTLSYKLIHNICMFKPSAVGGSRSEEDQSSTIINLKAVGDRGPAFFHPFEFSCFRHYIHPEYRVNLVGTPMLVFVTIHANN